jgi:hypothetical protein
LLPCARGSTAVSSLKATLKPRGSPGECGLLYVCARRITTACSSKCVLANSEMCRNKSGYQRTRGKDIRVRLVRGDQRRCSELCCARGNGAMGGRWELPSRLASPEGSRPRELVDGLACATTGPSSGSRSLWPMDRDRGCMGCRPFGGVSGGVSGGGKDSSGGCWPAEAMVAREWREAARDRPAWSIGRAEETGMEAAEAAEAAQRADFAERGDCAAAMRPAPRPERARGDMEWEVLARRSCGGAVAPPP